MTYEKAMYERLICDGCGVCVLEAPDVLCVAPEYDWWVNGNKHLCPMCRPDALVDRLDAAEAQVQAVRDACDAEDGDYISTVSGDRFEDRVRRAVGLDGDSNDG